MSARTLGYLLVLALAAVGLSGGLMACAESTLWTLGFWVAVALVGANGFIVGAALVALVERG